VNSVHPQVEQPLVNWLEVCRRRFPHAICNGSGRYAVTSICTSNKDTISAHVNRVTLVADKQVADALMKTPCGAKACSYCHEVNDLQAGLDLLARIPDRHYERERRA
jgi:hypothetical protein